MGKVHTLEGEPIRYASKPLRLHITRGDVEGAKAKNARHCVVAKACMRMLHAKEVRVHLSRVFVKLNKGWVRYATPPELRTEVITFDRGGRFAVGDYTLPPIRPHLRGSRPTGPKNSKKGKRRTPSVVTDVRIGPAHS